jgi:hypothetical protein
MAVLCPTHPPNWDCILHGVQKIVVQKTSSGTQTVIVGHDGSITRTFGDIRDDVLLEFETRIFNNLKLDGNPVPIESI